jgi:hypothetical protein
VDVHPPKLYISNMRKLLVVLCALGVMGLSVEAKKRPLPASQNTQISKEHKAMAKKIAKSRKAPKHRQTVN